MKESKAVLLGFGLVAAVMIAVVAFGCLAIATPPRNAQMDDPLSKAFNSAPPAGGGFERVPAVEALLPVGMPAAEAIGKLTADDFKCSRRPHEATCWRSVARMSASDDWKVTMLFDASNRLLSRSATHSQTSL